jgi:hypothetical protein
MMDEPRFPNATVKLSGEDGNAFSILGRVKAALQKAGATDEEVNEYLADSMQGDYDNLLQTALRWVTVE